MPEIDPAVAALSLWCRYRDSTETTHTQGETIYLGPDFPLLPISEQTGLLAHHVLHVALRHSARRAGARERYGAQFQAARFDLACDALVNEALLQGRHALPRPAVRAADIVALLPSEDRPQNVLADWDCERLYLAMATMGTGGGESGEIERYAAEQGFSPDLKGSEPSQTEASVWAGRVEQALSAGRRAGSGIGTVFARFGDLPKATVPWEIRLRRLLNKALAQHPRVSYRRPDRVWLARDALALQRGGAQPVFEPGRARDGRRPRLVVGLDTSSSITDQVLDMFAAEALSIVRRTGAEAHLLGFDTEVHTRARFDRAEATKALALRRGGGTHFGDVLREAQAMDPSLIVMLTDLDAPLGPPPAARVIWAVPVPPRVLPGFGEVLVLTDAADEGS